MDTCLLDVAGRVACTTSDGHLRLVAGLPPVAEVVLGWSSICARAALGEVECWDAGGQVTGMHAVSGVEDARSVGGHFGVFCAVRATGAVSCWDTAAGAERLADVPGAAGAVAVDYGMTHGCYVRDDGRALCWGDNRYGQLASSIADLSASTTPIEVAGLDEVAEVGCGDGFTCALSRGRVFCWGLYVGIERPPGNQWVPYETPGIGTVIDIGVGAAHVCALGEAGDVWCWGGNQVGQVGTGTTSTFEPATNPFGIHDGVLLATGGLTGQAHSCVQRRDGTVDCWGSGGRGELGNGATPLHSLEPTEMLPLCE